MSANAASSTATSWLPARVAAIAAADGSITARTSVSLRRNAGRGVSSCSHAMTSGSSMFHDSRGETRVPILGLASTNPFAASTLIASRSAVRLAAMAAPAWSASPGWMSPRRIRRPRVCTI